MQNISYFDTEVVLNPHITVVIGKDSKTFLNAVKAIQSTGAFKGVPDIWILSQSHMVKNKSCVLIEDVEHNLSPTKQREVIAKLLANFPDTQFIVTTNSPYVLGTVRGDTVIEVDGEKVFGIPECYGRSLNYISNYILDVPASIYEKEYENIQKLLSEENIIEGKRLYEILRTKMYPSMTPRMIEISMFISRRENGL